MQLGGQRSSGNVEDRRGMGGMVAGGGIGTLILAAVVYFLGGDPSVVLQSQPPARQAQPGAGQNDEGRQFVAKVLGSTEDTWNEEFKKRGRDYPEPTLVLFTDAVQSACGRAGSAVGPFYCPPDQKVYIDLGFYRDLSQRFGAPGDFAQAYVIAHEVGHHVQNVLGIADKVRAQEQANPRQANALSVKMELQADCLAGIWGHHANQQKKILDPGDLEEALRAASAIGDDSIQEKTQGRVRPESFTHGSSEQRVRWFRMGFDSGDPDRCDTFAGA